MKKRCPQKPLDELGLPPCPCKDCTWTGCGSGKDCLKYLSWLKQVWRPLCNLVRKGMGLEPL